jgi:ATP-dependent helicase HrpB
VIPLPIDPLLPDLVRSLASVPRLVLAAPPGAGKTTRVPRALLDAGMAADGEIVVLEPRRLAARMAARRVAEELGERVGETVGYTVRFEDASSARTRIRFVTEGVLGRKLVAEPELPGVACVLLDEFHERHLQGDVALALLQRTARRARRLVQIVMSATLATEPVARFLDAPILRAEGRAFEVAIEHASAAVDRPLELEVASAVRRLAREGPAGDVLVFLAGAAEIRRAREACEKVARDHDLEVCVLHGDLTAAEQDRVVRRGGRPKVILSTNVAESSVTIDGVVAVVDSGLARVASVAPWSGRPRLRVEKVSRASAIQRAGRAGRTQPGRCLRLYTKHDFDTRAEHDAPEVARADLAQTVLELRAAGFDDVAWLEAPPPASLRAAEELLRALGAVDERGAVTETGRRMARFGVHPRHARIVVEGERRGVVRDACVVAAMLGERDLRASSRAHLQEGRRFGRADGTSEALPRRGHDITERSDVLAMLDAFDEAEGSGFAARAMRAMDLDAGATMAVERGRRQLARLASAANREAGGEREILECILAGHPDRVARRVRQGGRALALSGGGSAELAEASAVRDAPWMVAVDAEERGIPERGPGGAGPGRSRGVLVRIASAIEPEWLIEIFPDSVAETTAVSWNAGTERVDAVDRMTYAGLVLHESPSSAPDGGEIARVLAEAAMARGARAFAPEGELDAWLARARFAASVDERVTAPTDDDVRAALVDACEGMRSFAELRHARLLEALARRAGASRDLDRVAPTSATLAAGRSVPIHYDAGKPPWIESYLQDFFGMKDTPRVGGGKTPVVLHLWAPNRRAVQVTSDLAGFWERAYPAVRKELMRRYPKHTWPEDPTKVAPRYKRQERR